MKVIKEHSLFVFILFICAILRFIPFFDYQFTLDELSGLDRTQFSNFDDLIEKGVKTTDTHPALVQLIIFAMAKLFGYANWIIKLPFLLFSFGAIVYAYVFCVRNFSKQSGVFASLIFCFSLIFVFYAPIARMYVSGIFFSMALLYYFFELFFQKNLKRSNFFFLGLFALLSALNQHINALFAFSLCAAGLLFLNKNNAKPYLVTCLLVVLFYLPHLPVTLYQLSVGGIGFDQGGWLPKPETNVLFRFFKVLLGTGKSYLVVLALVILSTLLRKKIRLSKQQGFLLSIFLVNFAIVYFYSQFRAPVFQNSVMLFSATALVIFIASLLEFKNVMVFYTASLLLSTVLLYKTYIKKDYYHQVVKTVFEYQYERTDYYKKKFGDAAVYPIYCDADTFMTKIYFHKYQTHYDCKITADSVVLSPKVFSRFVANLKSDYLILASGMPAQQALVQTYFPYLIENTQTQGINFKVYSKIKPSDGSLAEDDVVLNTATVQYPGNFNFSKAKQCAIQENGFVFPVDSLQEFPFDARCNYNNLVTHEGQILLLKAQIKQKRAALTQVEACIAVNDNDTPQNYSYNSRTCADFVSDKDSVTSMYVDNFFGSQHTQIKDRANITCYSWNKGKENFELRNFEIKLIDFWPQKWKFWE
jgi:hypothetical protein